MRVIVEGITPIVKMRYSRSKTSNSTESDATISSLKPFANSFFFRTHSSWNNLPYSVREITCSKTFKNSLTKYLWEDLVRYPDAEDGATMQDLLDNG